MLMGNKEIIFVIVIFAVIFAFLSVFADVAITGSSVKEFNTLSLNFAMITIVLTVLIALILIIELINFKKNK